MTSKSNPLKNIANQFSDTICHEFFKDKTTINGNEILSLTEFKQLNLFTLKNIFEKWKIEFNNHKSPLFDYDHDEVKNSVKEYMNTLSKHIDITEPIFNELLASSCEETLQIYTDPKEYFRNTFKNLPDLKLKTTWIEEYSKFYHSYTSCLLELKNKMMNEDLFSNDAIHAINEIIDIQGIESHESDVAEIKKIAGVDDLIISESKPAENDPNQSFFDSIEAYKKQYTSPKLKKTGSIVENTTPNEPEPVITKMRLEPVSINESAEQHSSPDLNSNFKSESIKSGISLNQKYLFINHLFNGDIDAFDKTIEQLETCQSLSEARDHALKPYIESNKWNISSVEVEEFFEILKRKYNK